MSAQDSAEREKFESEVMPIIEASNKARLTLRVLGSLAFQIHRPQFGYLQTEMGRAYTDIDFAAYGKQSKQIRELTTSLGYVENREVFILNEGGRAIFENPDSHPCVDVFYENWTFVARFAGTNGWRWVHQPFRWRGCCWRR